MTYHPDCTVSPALLEQLAADGLDALPELIRIMINTAMQVERQQHLGVAPYERSSERQGYANGYKPKTVTTRVGDITFAVPQVRDGSFYPQALEKGLRSERALLLALAEMYVQGVSTRKVAAITEHLCGTAISSAQVSRATAQLDAVLEGWRTRPLGLCRTSTWMRAMKRCGRMARCATLPSSSRVASMHMASGTFWASRSPSVSRKCIGARSSKAWLHADYAACSSSLAMRTPDCKRRAKLSSVAFPGNAANFICSKTRARMCHVKT